MYVCVGGIIPLPWFSKEPKNNLSNNKWLCGIILIHLIPELIFVGWGFPFPIVLVPRYNLYLCDTSIKPDLLGFPGIWCLCVWVAWPRVQVVRMIWYQSLAPLIRLYPFISCIFVFTFHVKFSLCCPCFGSDLVSKHVRRLHIKFQLNPTIGLRIMIVVVKLDRCAFYVRIWIWLFFSCPDRINYKLFWPQVMLSHLKLIVDCVTTWSQGSHHKCS
jgi:hypothetical protein